MSLQFLTTPLDAPAILDAAELRDTRTPSLSPDLRSAFLAHGAAATGLDHLFAGDAVCVTTGQQPGLFLGPMFTIYKAFSAVMLARKLAERLERPVIPVFWVAGDDHDFAEANHLYMLDLSNNVQELKLPDRGPSAPLTPLYKEPLRSEIEGVLASIVAATPDTEFRPSVLQ